jgi:hypothetical protein
MDPNVGAVIQTCLLAESPETARHLDLARAEESLLDAAVMIRRPARTCAMR